jgi:hypothetical protein
VSRNPVVVVALVVACIVVGGLAQRNLRTGLAGPRGEMPLNAGGETIHVTPTARRASGCWRPSLPPTRGRAR